VTAPVHETLGDLGERRIFTEILRPRYHKVRAFGDDCATLNGDLVVTTDSCSTALVEEIEIGDASDTGWLLVTMNLSDLAAAGARPEGLVVNYTLPPHTAGARLRALMDGVDACAKRHGTKVVGGDLRDSNELLLTATAIGRRPRRSREQSRSRGPLGRQGARAGDRLLVVGSPGYLWGAALLKIGWAVLPAGLTNQVYDRARRPMAQLRGGRVLAASGLAHAAMDVSDGLYSSVRTLCETNGLGAVMRDRIKLDDVLAEICNQSKISTFQLGQTWGDWPLLIAVAPADVIKAERILKAARVPVREVGRLVADPDALLVEHGDGRTSNWVGLDQERFSTSSWHTRSDAVESQLIRMRELSKG
jgi:thiamine-monophosphate kinase